MAPIASLILLIVAAICFLLAAVNETIFEQPPLDLVAWGLCFWAVSVLLGGAHAIYTKVGGKT